tara:strand:+ start:349 stop:786 length:438 start_codon:yes stop_codon:yes gene_type:complete
MADAQVKLVKTVNFGKGLADLPANVHFSLYDTLGAATIFRSSGSIYQVGIGTGIYGSEVSLSQHFSGSILWEVTASNGNVVFASDEVEIDSRLTRHFTVGQWEIDKATNEMIFYQDDNVTEMGRFDLKDSSGNPSTGEVFKRIRK